MIVVNGDSFADVHYHLKALLAQAPPVKTERWQGVALNTDTREVRNVCYEVPIDTDDLDHWRTDIRPNLPWADDHFLERVGGEPLNPGEQWKRWPWGQSARSALTHGIFNHTYMERLWPKWARKTSGGKLPNVKNLRRQPAPISMPGHPPRVPRERMGIANGYGDLQDLVELLGIEPYTRQAWIPLFFPEDTGRGDGGRKPCTLGYQVLVREGRAHMWYPLRSCDFRRHWNDDVYLAVRLLLWIIDQCRAHSPLWTSIEPGSLAMHMTSLHIFENDHKEISRW